MNGTRRKIRKTSVDPKRIKREEKSGQVMINIKAQSKRVGISQY